jgi:hypothetical protein
MARNRRYRCLVVAFFLASPGLSGAAPAPAPAPAPAIVRIGAAYIAKQLCSCLFVVQRAEASCRAEFRPEITAFTVAVERAGAPDGGKVTASLGPTVSEATYSPPYGCVIAK